MPHFLGTMSTKYLPQGMDEPGDFVKQLLADLVFFLSLNAFGYYLRYVGEINMRRSFLDKQGCIVETFKLKEEKEQEVSEQICKRSA